MLRSVHILNYKGEMNMNTSQRHDFERVDWNDGYTLMRALGEIAAFVHMTECCETWEELHGELLDDVRYEIEQFFKLDETRCDKIIEAVS